MKLAYLTGQYPKVSHTFIRREILGLTARGHDVVRLSVRPADSGIADPLDRDELARTHTFFAAPRSSWVGAFLEAALRSPRALASELLRIAAGPLRSGPGWIPRMAYLVEAAFFLRILRREGVQHVHAHFGRNAAAVAAIIHRLGGPGFSMTVHGPDEFDDPRGFELGARVAETRFTVAISSFTAAQLRRWADLRDWSKIHVVRCSVDADFFESPIPIEAACRTFVCVGRLCAQKGQLLLLEALAELVHAGVDCRLVLAGDGEMRAEVERRAAELGLGAHLEITGWIPEAEVRSRLRSARVMVLPSFAEGLPVVIMESLALGRPVISTFIAGIPELVDDTDGWIVPAGDVQALAGAMRQALDASVAELTEKGRLGRAKVRRDHFVETEVARLETLFKAAIPGEAGSVAAPGTRD